MNDVEHCFKIVQCFHNLCKKKKVCSFQQTSSCPGPVLRHFAKKKVTFYVYEDCKITILVSVIVIMTKE